MKVVVFDVDGTLTPIGSSWHYLHLVLGTRARSEAFKRAFFNSLISYEEWVYLDLSLWKGLSYETFKRVLDSIPWRSGIEELKKLIAEFSGEALFIAISCGFKELVERCIKDLGFNCGVGVEVEVDDRGRLTGRPRKFVSMWSKGEELQDILECLRGEDISLLVSIGDSVVDTPLFELSDISIAFCPSKDLLARYRDIDIVIKSCDLRKLVSVLAKILRS